MSALGFLMAWANAPFAIAVAIAVVFALLQMTGVLGVLAGGGEAEGEHDVDGDVGADVDHDVDADADHDVDGEHDADHDPDAHGGADRGLGAAALAPLGFGKIPFSIIWQTYAVAFALTGFGLNFRYFDDADGIPVVSLAWTLPSALIVGYVVVAAVARALGPVLSSSGQEATTRAQLVGQVGVVISSKVDEEFGEVRIRDKTGHDLRVICKLNKGHKRVPEEHARVVVVDYDDGNLVVEPLEPEEDDVEGKGQRAV